MLYLAPYIGAGSRLDPFRPQGLEGFAHWGAVDLRPASTQLAGLALLSLPTSADITGLDKIGQDRGESLLIQTRTRLGNRLGLDLSSIGTVEELIRELLFVPGKQWQPVQPRRDGLLEVWIGGVRWAELQTEPRSELLIDPTDNFNRANEDPLAGNWSTVTGIGSLRLVTNEMAGNGSNTDSGAYWNANTPSNDQFCEFEHRAGTTPDYGVGVRVSTSDFSMYMASPFPNVGGSTNEGIIKVVAGTFTAVATFDAGGTTAGDVIRAEVEGSTIRYKKNTVQQGSGTDSSLTSGRWGVFIFESDTRLDNWQGGDLGAPVLEQEGYRWRNDDGDEDGATWLANQDTNITRAEDLNTRLRVLVNTTNDQAATRFRLSYRKGTEPYKIIERIVGR